MAVRIGGACCERLPFASPSRRVIHRFVSPSPLIEPDVTISVIRLSDGRHAEAFANGSRGSCVSEMTPSSLRTHSTGN